jgi:replicative DNA helicase
MTPEDFQHGGREPEHLEDETDIDRLPPHSPEAERGVLGCLLLSPSECLAECVQKIKSPDVFYELRNRGIYQAMLALYAKGTPVDTLTVMQHLRDRKQLDEVGGTAYLASLPDEVPSAANLPYYLDIILSKHLLRRAIGICTDTAGRAFECNGDISAFLEELGQDVNEVIQEGLKADGGAGIRSSKQLVHTSLATIEEIYQNKGKPIGLCTGFKDFDDLTGGLRPGHMIVIAARPSVGKSSIAMNIADYVGCEAKQPVGVFSLEMPAEELMLRMICSRARVNSRNASSGYLKDGDFPKLTGAATKLMSAPLYIDDTGGLSALQLKAKARQMRQLYGIKLFIIDYLQLMHTTNRRAQNREQEISDISSGIKSLAKELSVPIIVLAQLNREVERRGQNSKPRLSDLRESGSIEQDADLVAMLYRIQEEEVGIGAVQSDSACINLLIAKQRNGPTGEIPLIFLKGYTKFEGAAPVKSNDPTENYPEP